MMSRYLIDNELTIQSRTISNNKKMVNMKKKESKKRICVAIGLSHFNSRIGI